jgi:peptidoglycan/LPS O-acetylase OafA/YrhL
LTTFIKYLLIGVIISIPAYFMSNHFIDPSTPNNISYNSLTNALLTWVVVGLFGILDVKEKKVTSLSSYIGVGILLSAFVLFISNSQYGGAEKNVTIILFCFVITSIFGLMELILIENRKQN